jgi:hypothetical protein
MMELNLLIFKHNTPPRSEYTQHTHNTHTPCTRACRTETYACIEYMLNRSMRVHVHGYMCGMRAWMYVSRGGIGDVQEKACMRAVCFTWLSTLADTLYDVCDCISGMLGSSTVHLDMCRVCACIILNVCPLYDDALNSTKQAGHEMDAS